MTREASDLPLIAMVGWKLGGELEGAVRAGAADASATPSCPCPSTRRLRPLVEWHRMPWPAWNSFRFRWIVFFILGGLRVRRIGADLVHTVGPTPIVPNRVDLNTVTFCHAAFGAATAGRPAEGQLERGRLEAGPACGPDARAVVVPPRARARRDLRGRGRRSPALLPRP